MDYKNWVQPTLFHWLPILLSTLNSQCIWHIKVARGQYSIKAFPIGNTRALTPRSSFLQLFFPPAISIGCRSRHKQCLVISFLLVLGSDAEITPWALWLFWLAIICVTDCCTTCIWMCCRHIFVSSTLFHISSTPTINKADIVSVMLNCYYSFPCPLCQHDVDISQPDYFRVLTVDSEQMTVFHQRPVCNKYDTIEVGDLLITWKQGHPQLGYM